MSGIQVFQNSHASDVIQMMWCGHVTAFDVQDALRHLSHLTQNLSHPANLVVVVASDTIVSSQVTTHYTPLSINANQLRGWMLIGDNKQANATIHRIMEHALPTT